MKLILVAEELALPIACRNHDLLLPTHTIAGFKSKCPNSFHFWPRRNQTCISEMRMLTWVKFPKAVHTCSHASILSDPKCLFS